MPDRSRSNSLRKVAIGKIFANRYFRLEPCKFNLTNPFNKLLFVVKDIESLPKNISNKGYNINQGPQ